MRALLFSRPACGNLNDNDSAEEIATKGTSIGIRTFPKGYRRITQLKDGQETKVLRGLEGQESGYLRELGRLQSTD